MLQQQKQAISSAVLFMAPVYLIIFPNWHGLMHRLLTVVSPGWALYLVAMGGALVSVGMVGWYGRLSQMGKADLRFRLYASIIIFFLFACLAALFFPFGEFHHAHTADRQAKALWHILSFAYIFSTLLGMIVLFGYRFYRLRGMVPKG